MMANEGQTEYEKDKKADGKWSIIYRDAISDRIIL
jgi:hypothetical protein